MPATNPDSHGNALDAAAVALLLIDVINDLEFEGGEATAVKVLEAPILVPKRTFLPEKGSFLFTVGEFFDL